MLVGNKLDLDSSRKTSCEIGEEFAAEEGLLFAEASAKSGDGVQELFKEIGRSESRERSAQLTGNGEQRGKCLSHRWLNEHLVAGQQGSR